MRSGWSCCGFCVRKTVGVCLDTARTQQAKRRKLGRERQTARVTASVWSVSGRSLNTTGRRIIRSNRRNAGLVCLRCALRFLLCCQRGDRPYRVASLIPFIPSIFRSTRRPADLTMASTPSTMSDQQRQHRTERSLQFRLKQEVEGTYERLPTSGSSGLLFI